MEPLAVCDSFRPKNSAHWVCKNCDHPIDHHMPVAKPKPGKGTTPTSDKYTKFIRFREHLLKLAATELAPEPTPVVTPVAIAKPIKEVHLFYTNPSENSDKVYNVSIDAVPGRTGLYNVNFSYGRRGSTLTKGTKNKNPATLTQAERIFGEIVDEKLGKGYTRNVSGR